MLSSPGISYKIYDYAGDVVFEGLTDPSAAAAAKKQLQSERAIGLDLPPKDGRYFLAFCDSSQHQSCSISRELMAGIGSGGAATAPGGKKGGAKAGKKPNKSWGFRTLRDAPAVIGAIPNMVVEGGKLVSSDQAFIIYNSVEDPFCNAAWSPLVIDLEGKGVALSSPEKGVLFDMNGDGTKDRISWPFKASSVFLALDRNGNGAIDSVHELFGDNTIGPDQEHAENGFAALAKYDENKDGRIDAKDAVFTELRLWGDKNRNGLSEPNELQSLPAAKLTSIDLAYVDMFEVDAYGNQTLQRSTVEFQAEKQGKKKKKGQETLFKMIFDIWFKM